MHFLDALTLELITDKTALQTAAIAVTQIAFAHTSEFAAVAFEDSAVGLFKLTPSNFEAPWEFIGRHRSHVGGVTQVFF